MYTQEHAISARPVGLFEKKKRVLKHLKASGPVLCSIRLLFSSLLVILITMPSSSASSVAQFSSLTSRSADDSSLLDCLQVAAPVFSPTGGCQQTLMIHTFAQSYGEPFVGK